MKRSVLVLLTTGTLCALSAAPAVADSSDLGTSYAAAANVTAGTGISAAVSTNGDLGDLLDFLSPVVDQFVTPVATALNNLPTTMSSDVAADLETNFVANSSSSTQSAPDDGSYPACTSNGWSSDNCYGVDSVTSEVNPLVSLSADAVRGYAAADSTASTGSARTARVTLSALGFDVGTLGTAQSTTSCTVAGQCATTASFADASLLSGAIQAQSAADGSVQVSINGGDFQPVSGLGDPVTVTDGDTTATAQDDGDALEISIPMTLDQLLAGLGVTDDLSDLSAYDDDSQITLDVILGGSDGADGAARGAGLRVGLGVDADIKVSVYGLVGASVTVSDSSTGNTAELQLAFTAATAPSQQDSGGPVDPANVK